MKMWFSLCHSVRGKEPGEYVDLAGLVAAILGLKQTGEGLIRKYGSDLRTLSSVVSGSGF